MAGGDGTTLEKIKQVRARVEVSIAVAKSALVAAEGDVDAAVRALMTPEQLTRERNAAIAVEIVAEASRQRSPEVTPAPASPPAHVVTMNGASLCAILAHAPALEAFAAAVHPASRLVRLEERWDRFGDGRSQHTTMADFVLGEGGIDLQKAIEFTVAALARKRLRELPFDAERARSAFEDGPRCLRVGPWQTLLPDQLSTTLRIDLLAPSSDEEGNAMLAPEIRSAPAMRLGTLTGARREHVFRTGDVSPYETSEEATLRSGSQVIALTLAGGLVRVERR